MQQWLPFVVSGVVSVAMLVLMSAAKHGQPKGAAGTDRLVYRYSSAMELLAIALAIVPLVLITALLFSKPPKTVDDYGAITAMYALCLGICGPLLWEALRFSMTVGPDEIEGRSPWRGAIMIRWADVESVSYNWVLGYFVVRATDGRKFRISGLVAGLNSFLATCERHLTVEQLQGAVSGYGFVGRDFPES